MAKEEIALQNFSGGELSPKMFGRFDLPVYKNGARRVRNFISETQGSARFRNGFPLVHYTRLNQVANLIKFEFNDEQAYQLEFTHKKLRFHKDEGVITEGNKTITGITQANPGVVTSVAHGYADGDEVFITGVKGMIQANGKSYRVAGVTANTFQLTNIDAVNVNTTGYGAYTSGGVANRIYEIDTPYDEALDLFALKVTQNADTMYIDHPYYDSRKLTRTGHTAWTLVRYTRTADPFLSKKVISAITQANPAVVTAVAHGYVTGGEVIIEEVVGMTQVNSTPYKITVLSVDTFSLQNILTGANVDSTGFTAYGSVGFASNRKLLPSCLTFYEGRIWHAGITSAPDKFIGSRSPVPTTGATRYEDFTAGTDPDHAVYYTIADGEVNKILWLIGTNRLMFAGTFGTETRITGDTIEEPITPTSINVRAENRLGVADITPINKENIVIYVQRGSLTLRSFEFDALQDRFISTDRNLVSDHIAESGIKQLTWQSGRPDVVWAVRNDGKLVGLTFKFGEDVSGWHLHNTGLAADKFISCSTMPRPSSYDQLWVVTERVVNGITRRFVEFMEDEAPIPDFFDYFTGEDNYDTDRALFELDMAEAQKRYFHLDCGLTYDGLTSGIDAGASVTPAAATGTSVVFTASTAVFASTDVGREIWKKTVDGVGTGRARITAFTSTTQVTCNIISDFDNANAMAAGAWYLTAGTLITLDHLEGRVVSIVTDGGLHPNKTVSGGSITLDYQASVIHVGLKYEGVLQPMSIEAGGTTGPSQGKLKNVYKVGVRFYNTLGADIGTDFYNPEEIGFTEIPLNIGAPQLLFTGVKDVHYSDGWDLDKLLFIKQKDPLPCTVQMMEIFTETAND